MSCEVCQEIAANTVCVPHYEQGKLGGQFLPVWAGEQELDCNLRAVLYFFAMVWIFLGVAIVSDTFMDAISKISSQSKQIIDKFGRVYDVQIWNDTVANLTIMALGSSAPEILISLVEIFYNDMHSDELGPSTIVGSASFNLFCISAMCIVCLPKGENRRIHDVEVFGVTSISSLLAYLWMCFILLWSSPNIIDMWEAVITLLFFPFLIMIAYLVDVGYFRSRGSRVVPQGTSIMPTDNDEVRQIVRELVEQNGANMATGELCSLVMGELGELTKYKRNVKKARCVYYHSILSNHMHLQTVNKVREQEIIQQKKDQLEDRFLEEAAGNMNRCDVEIEFATASYAVLENAGKKEMEVLRSYSWTARLM